MTAELEGWGYAREERPPTAMGWMGMAPVAPAEMPGMATEAELDALRQAEGRAADALFVALLSAHHAGGLHMADFAAEHAADDEVRAIAARIARNQRQEIAELEAARQRAGLPEPTSVPA
ncbi:hypothetical protein BH18ACT1_BH18ACT1_07720 [soil metagenome]